MAEAYQGRGNPSRAMFRDVASPSSTLFVRSGADLGRLRGPRAVPAFRRRKIKVDIPGVPDDDARDLEAQLNAAANACGCGEGAVGAILGAALAIAHTVAVEARVFPAVGLILTAFFAGAFVGKIVGLLKAQIRFRRAIACVERAIDSTSTSPMRS